MVEHDNKIQKVYAHKIMLKLLTYLFTALVCILLLPPVALSVSPIAIGVPDDVLVDYHSFMRGRNPKDITDYSGPDSRRDVVEVILFQQALKLGGMDCKILFRPVPTYRRLLEELRAGNIASAGASFWIYDLEKDIKSQYISEPVIDNGEYEAGLYTAPDNLKALDAKTLADVRKLTAASNRYWIPDWLTLTSLHLRDLHHIQNWKTMVRMVANKRADFLLAPFQSTEEMVLEVDNMTLVPIKGLKVGLQGSRHFAISKKYPEGRKLYQALQRGVAKLKEQGRFRQAYMQCGFIHPGTKDWLFINPPDEGK